MDQLTQLSAEFGNIHEALRQTAEIQRAYRLERYQRRKSAQQAAIARFRANNPEAWRKIRAKAAESRKARKMAAREGLTQEQIAEADAISRQWLDATEFVCAYCAKETPKHERTIDHVIPQSKGGKHLASNLARACKSCNSRKSNHSYFYA